MRAAISPYHDADDRFLKTVERHRDLGKIDFRHLPLALLREIDPVAFGKLEHYEGYALVRDPTQRFRSAMAQRAKMYLGKEFAQLSEDDIRAETKRVITYLKSEPRVISPDFIHFSRQSDFIQIDGTRLVQSLYPVERLDLFALALGQHIGMDRLEIGHVNKTTVFRYSLLKNVAHAGSDITRRIVPEPVHEVLRQSARKMLMKSSDLVIPQVFRDNYTLNFIRDYYAADIALHKQVLEETAMCEVVR